MIATLLFASVGFAKTIQTNHISMSSAPNWVTKRSVVKIEDRIQNELEWSIRKIRVYWYSNQREFEKLHGKGPLVRAFTKRSDLSIHLGPAVSQTLFSGILGHELVHVVILQKYHSSIPNWLDEGMANTIAKNSKVDYRWLASQPLPPVKSMSDPFLGGNPRLMYQMSTAVMEMISKKCDIHDLLQLSLKSKLEIYLSQTCELTDLDSELKVWIHKKTGKLSPQKK